MSQQIPERIPGGAVDLSFLAQRAAAPGATAANGGAVAAGGSAPSAGGAGGQTVDVPSLVFDVTEDSFQQAVQLSGVVPVIVELWSSAEPRSTVLSPLLETLAREQDGRLVVARADVSASPGFIQAFQLQAIPAAVALVAGRPVPLFEGAASEDQIRDIAVQLVQLAAQQGVTGRVNAPDMGSAAGDGPTEPPVNPAHSEALDALERGDFVAAQAAYEQVLLKAPADDEAKAALAQVRLLVRLEGRTADEIRAAAAAAPTDLEAQFGVADLDVSGGHVEDAFLRLLDLFQAVTDAGERTRVRERLLELFEVVGNADPRVSAARNRLANLLY